MFPKKKLNGFRVVGMAKTLNGFNPVGLPKNPIIAGAMDEPPAAPCVEKPGVAVEKPGVTKALLLLMEGANRVELGGAPKLPRELPAEELKLVEGLKTSCPVTGSMTKDDPEDTDGVVPKPGDR